MGPEWGDREILVLFELVRRVWSLDPKSEVTVEEGVLPKVRERILAAWARYRDSQVAV
jgi:hypothetical protein